MWRWLSKTITIFFVILGVIFSLIIGFCIWGVFLALNGDPEVAYKYYFSSPDVSTIAKLQGTETHWMDYSASISFIAETPPQLKKASSYIPVTCTSRYILNSAFIDRVGMSWETALEQKVTDEYSKKADVIAANLMCYEYKGPDEEKYLAQSWLVHDPATHEYFFSISGNSKPPVP